MIKKIFSTLCLLIVAQGCATQGKSLGLGAGIGAGVGMGAGAIADPNARGEYRTRNVIIGGALGSIIGLATGSAIYNSQEKAKAEGFKNGQANAPQPPPPGVQPLLSQPKVESRWVEPKVVGNRFVEGHFEYVITEPAKWEP